MKRPGDQDGDLGQRPPLIGISAISGRTCIQRDAEPRQLPVIKLAPGSARALGCQGRVAAARQARRHWYTDFVLTCRILAIRPASIS